MRIETFVYAGSPSRPRVQNIASLNEDLRRIYELFLHSTYWNISNDPLRNRVLQRYRTHGLSSSLGSEAPARPHVARRHGKHLRKERGTTCPQNLEKPSWVMVNQKNVAVHPLLLTIQLVFLKLWMSLVKVFFRTFPQHKKVRHNLRTRGRHCHMTDYYNLFLFRHRILLLLSEELSSQLPDSFEGFSPSPSVVAFEFGAGEDDCPFRL